MLESVVAFANTERMSGLLTRKQYNTIYYYDLPYVAGDNKLGTVVPQVPVTGTTVVPVVGAQYQYF